MSLILRSPGGGPEGGSDLIPGEDSYLCDVRGGGGGGGLSSEGLRAQQETRRRAGVTLKGTHIIGLRFQSKVTSRSRTDAGSAALTPGASYVNVLLITGTSCQ